jgi:hypothetical protein
MKSTEAYIFFLCGAPISWRSRREPIVAYSSTLAEFIAWDTAVKEVLWLQQLCMALGFNVTEPTVIHTDSANALTNLNKPTYTTGYKWVEIRFWFVKDVIKQGDIQMKKIDGKLNVADSLTKPLPEPLFRDFIKRLNYGVMRGEE